jgi:hypothetical protein
MKKVDAVGSARSAEASMSLIVEKAIVGERYG